MLTSFASSLRVRLVCLVALLVGGVVAFLGAYFPRQFESQLRESLQTRGLVIGGLMAQTLEAPVEFDDAVSAESYLQYLKAAPVARYARVIRPDGSVLATWGNRPDLLSNGAAVTSQQVAFLERSMEVSMPIAQRTGPGGVLQIGFTLDGHFAAVRSATDKVMLAALVVAIVGLFAAFGIGTVYTRPIRRITDAAHEISQGARSEVLDFARGRDDEVGQMAHALVDMLQRLFDHQTLVTELNWDLKELNNALEGRVADRTALLVEINSELQARLAELKSTQEQLIAADRRVAVGQLAAGVAHEINNPLAYVLGNITFAIDELKDLGAGSALDQQTRQEMISALNESRQGAERVKFIVQSLKTLSRGDDGKTDVVSAKECVESAISMAMNQIKHRAKLVREYSPVPNLIANEVRLGQVVLNLLMNATQAMEGMPSDRCEIRVGLDTRADGRVAISVADTGSGMTPEVRQRLFQPFFTTKPVGIGTGLGLSICQGIIRGLGGDIEVTSELGKGSCFTVVLPGAPSDATSERVRIAPPKLTAGGRVLVIDDDPLVGAAIKRTLGKTHDVTVMTDASRVLSELRALGNFDLILCDLMMPTVTGMDVHEQLRASDPALLTRLSFMTGGAFTAAARAFADAHKENILDKPLDPHRLAELLGRALQGGRQFQA